MNDNCLLMFGHMRYIDVNYINNFFSNFDVFIQSSNTHNFDEQIKSINNLKHYESNVLDFSHLPEKKGQGRVRNIYSMWRSVFLCGSMKVKHEEIRNKKYERVLIQRSDLVFNNSINFGSIDHNTVCTHDSNFRGNRKHLINDHMCVTNSENADRYTSLFNNIDDYFNRSHDFVSENILRLHIDSLKIPHSIHIFDYSIKARDVHKETKDWKSIERRDD